MIWRGHIYHVVDNDGPSPLHAWSLVSAIKVTIGDKPSVRMLDGELLSIHFHRSLSLSEKASVEAIVAAHDGTTALAADAAQVAAEESARDATRADRAALGARHRARLDPMGAGPLSEADRQRALDYLLDDLL